MDTTNTNYNGMGDLIALVLLSGLLGMGNIPPGFGLGKHPTPEADPSTSKDLDQKLKKINSVVGHLLENLDFVSTKPDLLEAGISSILTIANDLALTCKVRSELAKSTPNKQP